MCVARAVVFQKLTTRRIWIVLHWVIGFLSHAGFALGTCIIIDYIYNCHKNNWGINNWQLNCKNGTIQNVGSFNHYYQSSWAYEMCVARAVVFQKLTTRRIWIVLHWVIGFLSHAGFALGTCIIIDYIYNCHKNNWGINDTFFQLCIASSQTSWCNHLSRVAAWVQRRDNESKLTSKSPAKKLSGSLAKARATSFTQAPQSLCFLACLGTRITSISEFQTMFGWTHFPKHEMILYRSGGMERFTASLSKPFREST